MGNPQHKVYEKHCSALAGHYSSPLDSYFESASPQTLPRGITQFIVPVCKVKYSNINLKQRKSHEVQSMRVLTEGHLAFSLLSVYASDAGLSKSSHCSWKSLREFWPRLWTGPTRPWETSADAKNKKSKYPHKKWFENMTSQIRIFTVLPFSLRRFILFCFNKHKCIFFVITIRVSPSWE